MPKPVAVDGDTQVETSTKKQDADANKTGRWTLVSSSVTRGSKVSVGGKLVELGATASWSYVDGSSGNSPIPPISDSATLRANPTRLKDSGSDLLVDGDEAHGTVDGDNKIVVAVSQTKLRTD
jgi:hypothetical protein